MIENQFDLEIASPWFPAYKVSNSIFKLLELLECLRSIVCQLRFHHETVLRVEFLNSIMDLIEFESTRNKSFYKSGWNFDFISGTHWTIAFSNVIRWNYCSGIFGAKRSKIGRFKMLKANDAEKWTTSKSESGRSYELKSNGLSKQKSMVQRVKMHGLFQWKKVRFSPWPSSFARPSISITRESYMLDLTQIKCTRYIWQKW